MPDSREHPIIFTPDSVRAILDGRKTQTRRLVKPQGCMQPECWDNCVVQWSQAGHDGPGWYAWDDGYEDEGSTVLHCPYGQPGDVLWVRETFSVAPTPGCTFGEAMMGKKLTVTYPADGGTVDLRGGEINGVGFHLDYAAVEYPPEKYGIPSIHMPKWACRLLLKVEAVRVERLQEISEEDYFAEGLRMPPIERTVDGGGAEMVDAGGWWRREFRVAWDTLNGKRAPWESNPWVWVVEFSRMEGKA